VWSGLQQPTQNGTVTPPTSTIRRNDETSYRATICLADPSDSSLIAPAK
jgi:hypothetical protein